MARDDGDFQRARRPEQKRLRERAIIEAAQRLALRNGGVRNVSLGDIATEVGMHKSALLRYFGTREEIYLNIATEAWQEWSETLEAQLKTLARGDVTGIAAAFAATLQDRPLLCDLFTHTSLNLERNVSITAIFTHKLAAVTEVKVLSNAVRKILPELTDDDGAELVAAITILAAGVWQVSHPSPTVAKLYVDHPGIGNAVAVDFVTAITRVAETLALGLLAKRAR